MSRLDIKSPSRAQTVVDNLYRDVERRIAASPPGLCPVDMSLSFLQLCHAQSCGKCVPCRIGLGQLSKLIATVLDGTADMSTIAIIEKTARTIVNTADCAIGRDAARLVLDGLDGFRDDYEEHIIHHRCLAGLQLPVPCVALCPAGVDVPGYMALVGEGRCADAVRLIRKDNPFPTACAYICEHPCEARCRRNMVDDALNIRGLKRYAVDHAGDVPQPKKAPATGKSVAIVGGGPGGLSAAYYLALMGHKVTVYEKRQRLGGMMRYGIPSYRLPREKLDQDIQAILSLGIQVHTGVSVGQDVSFEELKREYDSLYLSIGAQTDKKTGIPGEDSAGVISAVELLRQIGDGDLPDFHGKQVVGIGGGRVMDLAKAVGASGGWPVAQVPTSVATCAAFTPLSVMYHEDGSFCGTWRYEREIDAVLVDLEVMATQPPRLIAAGVLDAMAKVPELAHGAQALDEAEQDVQRWCAYQYALVNNEQLSRYAVAACEEAAAGKPGAALERVVYLNLALTGIVSALTRGFHQTALAHKFYDGMRTLYAERAAGYLHGELVAIGLIMQLVFNGEGDEAARIQRFMRGLGMPGTLPEIGIPRDDAGVEALARYIDDGEFVGPGAAEQARFARAFEALFL